MRIFRLDVVLRTPEDFVRQELTMLNHFQKSIFWCQALLLNQGKIMFGFMFIHLAINLNKKQISFLKCNAKYTCIA